MADLLTNSLSGLRAFQQALDTIGHNIANSATPGYSRQRVQLGTLPPQYSGVGYVGSGTQVTGIQRLFDDMLAAQTRTASAAVGRLEIFGGNAARMDKLLADENLSPVKGMQLFYGALDDLAADPASIELRENFLAVSDTAAARFRTLDAQFAALGRENDAAIKATVDEVNRVTENIAALNREIAVAPKNGVHGQPNDLLDQRDRLLDQLSTLVGVSSTVQDDGSVNIYTGSGQPLIVGGTSYRLSSSQNVFDASRTEVTLGSEGGSAVITDTLSGGRLGGLLDYRDELLNPARRELARIAAGFAQSMNAQHGAGMDLDGRLGGDLFDITPKEALAAKTNSGDAQVDIRIDDAGALQSERYLLRFDGSAWTLGSLDGGGNIPLSGSGTAADPFRAAGLSFTVDGAAQAGDSFLLDPLAGAAGSLEVAIDDPRRIAAAAPIRTSAAASNTGSAAISEGSVVDATHPDLLADVNITFTSATTYSINGAGSYTYTPGEAIDINGWQVSIDGAPNAGDSFSISANVNGTGDNRNLTAMAGRRDAGVLDNGGTDIEAALGRLVARVGAQTSQAEAALGAQNAILAEAQASREAVSGVNLDEEAAELLRFQQAYQAAAQAVAVADELFQTLLGAVRR